MNEEITSRDIGDVTIYRFCPLLLHSYDNVQYDTYLPRSFCIAMLYLHQQWVKVHYIMQFGSCNTDNNHTICNIPASEISETWKLATTRHYLGYLVKTIGVFYENLLFLSGLHNKLQSFCHQYIYTNNRRRHPLKFTKIMWECYIWRQCRSARDVCCAPRLTASVKVHKDYVRMLYLWATPVGTRCLPRTASSSVVCVIFMAPFSLVNQDLSVWVPFSTFNGVFYTRTLPLPTFFRWVTW